TRAADDRVTSVTLADGTAIDPAGSYTAAVNGFLATGGDGFTVLKDAANPTSVGSDLDALEHHIEALPQPFVAPDPASEHRITRAG
ncbi:MAG: 5-nucleotidase, partial [Baekduia sp.]|nr:5-nucleotidase [Baekduia sp.]